MSDLEEKEGVVQDFGGDEGGAGPHEDDEKSIDLLQWYLKLALEGDGEDKKM